MNIPQCALPCNRHDPGRLTPDAKRWQDGDWLQYYSSEETLRVFAGLFWPCGMEPWGMFFRPGGEIKRVTDHEARAMAYKDKVVFVRAPSYQFVRV